MFVDPVSDKGKCGNVDSVFAKTCTKPEFHQQNLCEDVQVLCSELRIKDIFLLERHLKRNS